MPDFCRATPADILRLIEIRGSVQENRLSDPSSVTPEDYHRFVTQDRVWVARTADRIVGFSASDPTDGTIWALFVELACQGSGLGALLLRHACADLGADGFTTARLTTDPGTRAERLYRKLGWVACGMAADGEVKFEKAL